MCERPVPSNGQLAEVTCPASPLAGARPGKGAFDDPPFTILRPHCPVRSTGFALPVRRSAFGGNTRRNPSMSQGAAQWSTVKRPVGDELFDLGLGSSAWARHSYLCQCGVHKRDFRVVGTGEMKAKGKPLRVHDQHPLGAFPLLGQPDAESPLFAGAKLPSIDPCDQSIPPRSSNSLKTHR